MIDPYLETMSRIAEKNFAFDEYWRHRVDGLFLSLIAGVVVGLGWVLAIWAQVIF